MKIYFKERKNYDYMNRRINSTFMEQIMKQVINVEDLFWFVEKYDKYYKEHNGENVILIPRV